MLKKFKDMIVPQDLVPEEFPEITWDSESLDESVETVFRYVVREAEKTWRFYYDRRRTKRLFSLILRQMTIISLFLAGIIPVLGEIYKIGNDPFINPTWASVALVVGGLFGTLDKFGGFSTGRARFLVTGQKIFQDLETFRLEWEKSKLEREGGKTDKSQAVELINRCKDFHQGIRNTMKNEIEQWKKEYQASLSQKTGILKG